MAANFLKSRACRTTEAQQSLWIGGAQRSDPLLFVCFVKPREELDDGGLGDTFTLLVQWFVDAVPLVEGFFRYDILVVKRVKENAQNACRK